MHAKRLWKWMREHRAAEAGTEVETDKVGEMSGLEEKQRATTEEGMMDGGRKGIQPSGRRWWI